MHTQACTRIHTHTTHSVCQATGTRLRRGRRTGSDRDWRAENKAVKSPGGRITSKTPELWPLPTPSSGQDGGSKGMGWGVEGAPWPPTLILAPGSQQRTLRTPRDTQALRPRAVAGLPPPAPLCSQLCPQAPGPPPAGAGCSSGRRPPEDPHCFPRDPSINSQSPPPAGPGDGFLSGNPGQPAMPRTPVGMGQGAEGSSSPVSWAPLQGPTPRARACQLPPGPGPEPSHRVGRAAQLWALSLAARPGQ